MKILLLTNKFPFPPKDGGAIATFNLIKSFSKLRNEVVVLSMNTSKHLFDTTKLPDEVKKIAHFISVKVNNKLNAFDAFVNLIQNKSYNISRFISEEFNNKLIEILHEKKFDLVQLEGLYLSPYVETIRTFSDAKISMRAHNVEHQIWERNADYEKGIIKKKYLKTLSKQLKKYELARIGKYDFMVPISISDYEYFKNFEHETLFHVCTASFDEELLNFKKSKVEISSLFFMGSLDWIPNLNGLNWFIKNPWKEISTKFPKLKFYIAGRNMPGEIKNIKEKNIYILGEIDDAYDFMNSKQIMIVPLFSGSGMRVKIIEGLALEKTIVSTSIGAEGIGLTDKENILIANDAKEFISCISYCISNPSAAKNIGINGLNFVYEKFSALATAKNLINFYSKYIKK